MTTLDRIHARMMADPDYRREYEALAPEFEPSAPTWHPTRTQPPPFPGPMVLGYWCASNRMTVGWETATRRWVALGVPETVNPPDYWVALPARPEPETAAHE